MPGPNRGGREPLGGGLERGPRRRINRPLTRIVSSRKDSRPLALKTSPVSRPAGSIEQDTLQGRLQFQSLV